MAERAPRRLARDGVGGIRLTPKEVALLVVVAARLDDTAYVKPYARAAILKARAAVEEYGPSMICRLSSRGLLIGRDDRG